MYATRKTQWLETNVRHKKNAYRSENSVRHKKKRTQFRNKCMPQGKKAQRLETNVR